MTDSVTADKNSVKREGQAQTANAENTRKLASIQF